MNKFIVMFLFISSVAYGQDLIKVDVKMDLDKLIELLDKKDKEMKMYRNMSKDLHAELNRMRAKIKSVNALNDSLYYYKFYFDHSKHVIGPRVIKKIEAMIKTE